MQTFVCNSGVTEPSAKREVCASKHWLLFSTTSIDSCCISLLCACAWHFLEEIATMQRIAETSYSSTLSEARRVLCADYGTKTHAHSCRSLDMLKSLMRVKQKFMLVDTICRRACSSFDKMNCIDEREHMLSMHGE